MKIIEKVLHAFRELGKTGSPLPLPYQLAAQSTQPGGVQYLRTQSAGLVDEGKPDTQAQFRAKLNTKSDSGHNRDFFGPANQSRDASALSEHSSANHAVRSAFIRRTGMSYAVVYISRSTSGSGAHDQLRELRRSCRVRNDNLNVASGLVLQDGMFCQWLEGSQDVVEAIYQSVKRDPRHEAVMCLFRGEVRASMLDSWCMGTRSLSMSPRDAFERACALRQSVGQRAFESAYAAWMGFAGLLRASKSNQPPEADGLFDGNCTRTRTHTRSVCVISHRSALSGQLLADANLYQGVRMVLSRWGGEGDADGDLQSAEALATIGVERAHMICTSFRSLRVGILREKVLRSGEIWVAMPSDDMSQLDGHLQALKKIMPEGLGTRLVSVLAPSWTEATRAHSLHLLKMNQFAGQTAELDLSFRGCWQKFTELT